MGVALLERRHLPAEYKLRILPEADAVTEPGELGALLRREGLYSSLLSSWRRDREAAARERMGRKRGPKPSRNPLARRVAELERQNGRLQRRLRQAETIIAFQKKVSEVLGIPLSSPDSDESD
jgi:transposase